MPRKRLAMRQVHEVLRLKWVVGLSDRQIARSLGLSRPTVAAYVQRAQAAGVSWPLPDGLDATTLEQRLFPPSPAIRPFTPRAPDWPTVHHELKRKGVTLFLLWQEYKATTPEGFQYSWFCQAYRAWASKLTLVMRQNHRAGEKLFVDYAGQVSRSLTAVPVRSVRRRSLLRSWAPPTIPMSKPRGRRVSRTGLAPMCGSLPPSVACLTSSSPITSRRL